MSVIWTSLCAAKWTKERTSKRTKGWNIGRVALLSRKPAVSLKWCKIGLRLLLMFALSIGAKINDLGWPWRVIMHSFSKHMHLSERTTKIWMKMDPYIPSAMRWLYFLSMLGLCGYSPGFPGEWASNDSGVIENVDFKGFRTLRLRHLRK